jgi:hypothetical protein
LLFAQRGDCPRRLRQRGLVPLPVMLSSFSVASTKTEAALVRSQG